MNNTEELWLDLCKKELEVIKKIKIEVTDMTGTLVEAKERLKATHCL